MKVVCLISGLGSGGAERQLVGLAGLLKERKYEVRLVYYHEIHFYRLYLDECGVEAVCIRRSKVKWINLLYVIRHILDFRPDAVIAYLDGPSLLACVLKMFRSGLKLIVSERTSTQCLPLTFKKRIKFHLYRYADWVVPNSHAEAAYLQNRFPFLKHKVYPITNFVDTERFRPAGRNAIAAGTVKILTVGRIIASKNAIGLMRVTRRLLDKGYDLKVMWYGKPEQTGYYDRCLQEMADLNLNGSFCFAGETESMAEVYRAADVFCLPSWREGFPNVICESMAAGLPVLCSRTGDNPYIISEGENGYLFDPFSEKETENAFLKFLACDNAQREQMGRKSREIAEEKFAKKTFVDRYMHLLRSATK